MEKKYKHRSSESDLRALAVLQAIPDMVFRMDGHGVFLDYKAKFEDLHTQSIPTIVGRRCRDIADPEFAELVERYISLSLTSGLPQTFEYRLSVPGKGLRDYEAHMAASGRNEVIAIVRDVTEKNDMTRMLRTERDLRSAIVEAAIDGMLVIGSGGSVVAHNRKFLEVWGIPDDALGAGTDERLLQEVRDKLADPDGFMEKVQWLYENREEVSRDEIELLDGRVLDRYSAPAVGSDGNYYGRVWYFRDMTERKVLENELKAHRDHLGNLVAERTAEMQKEVVRRTRREEQYLALIESVIEWVWEVDTHFVHTYLSPRVFDVLGYAPEELIGTSPADVMPEDERKRAMPVIRQVIAREERFVAFQNVCLHKDGRRIFIETNGGPFYNLRGKLMGYRGSARDVTEHRKILDALKEREVDLTAKSKSLEDVNSALRVLLKQRENDRKELEQRFMSNVREMVLPYVEKLQKKSLESQHRAYLDIIAANLDQLTSPFVGNVTHLNFTPREIEVASLIRDGKSTKEIAEIMGVAPSAVHSHRDNIRKKLLLKGRDVNLRSYLRDLR